MFAHKQIWRSFRPPVAFSDIETSKRRKMVCPKSHGFRVQPSFLLQAWWSFSTSPLSFLLHFHWEKAPHIPSTSGFWLLHSARPFSVSSYPLLIDDPFLRGKDKLGCTRAHVMRWGCTRCSGHISLLPSSAFPLLFGEKKYYKEATGNPNWMLCVC